MDEDFIQNWPRSVTTEVSIQSSVGGEEREKEKHTLTSVTKLIFSPITENNLLLWHSNADH